MDFYSKDPKSLAHDLRGTIKAVLFLAVLMSLYAYATLSTNKYVFPAALLLLIVLEIVQVISLYRKGKELNVTCEVLYFLVLFTAFLGIYRKTMTKDDTFLWATVFYRPYYTFHRNRRLAIILGVVIAIVALPVTFGIVTDRESVSFLGALYFLLVVGLWIFCSKFGARFFGFEEDAAEDSDA